MTQDEKAARYDEIVREADTLTAKLSRKKSEMIGNSSVELEREINSIKNRLNQLEKEMQRLFY